MPNAKLAQAIVTNYHLPDKRMSASVQVAVSYAADPDHVERVLLDVATRAARGDSRDAGRPRALGHLRSGLRRFCPGLHRQLPGKRILPAVRCAAELRKRILRRLRQEGIEIPFPTRTVLLESPPRAEGHAAGPAV